MFMTLMDGAAWIVVIGLAVLVFVLLSAGLGALTGSAIALFKRKRLPL